MTTIYDVSKLAGVSLATVSRVMNKKVPVSEKTKQKVANAMAQLDYRPNAAAKSLASNQTRSVGVLVSELHGPFFGSLISEIEQVFRAEDVHVIFAAGHSNPVDEKEAIEFLISRQCDALILFVEAVSDSYLYALSKQNVPIIILGRDIPKMKKRCLDIDHIHGGFLATEHLIQHGHRDIGFVSGPDWKKDSQQRLAGYRAALRANGLAINEQLVFGGDYHEASGAAALKFYLTTEAGITGVVCANDEMAAGLLLASRERGIKVPQDLSLVGIDDAAFSHYLSPALTTVRLPVQELAKNAACRVLHEVYQRGSVTDDDTKLELIQRSSVSMRQELKSEPLASSRGDQL